MVFTPHLRTLHKIFMIFPPHWITLHNELHDFYTLLANIA
jgi:hypothetical protein